MQEKSEVVSSDIQVTDHRLSSRSSECLNWMLLVLCPGSQEFNNNFNKSSFGALSKCNVFCWIACALFKSITVQMEYPQTVVCVPKCCCPNTSVNPRVTCINTSCPFLLSARGEKTTQNKPSQPNHPYLSSLATSLCWESSRISGKLVMISCWIGTGETLTICINFLTRSCRQEEPWWNAQISQHNNNIMHPRSLSATSAWVYAHCPFTLCPADVMKHSTDFCGAVVFYS